MTDASNNGATRGRSRPKLPFTVPPLKPRGDIIVALIVATVLQLSMGLGKLGHGWDIAVDILCVLSAYALARSRHWPSDRAPRAPLHTLLRWEPIGVAILAIVAGGYLGSWVVEKFTGNPDVLDGLTHAAILHLLVGNAAARVLLLCLPPRLPRPAPQPDSPQP